MFMKTVMAPRRHIKKHLVRFIATPNSPVDLCTVHSFRLIAMGMISPIDCTNTTLTGCRFFLLIVFICSIDIHCKGAAMKACNVDVFTVLLKK